MSPEEQQVLHERVKQLAREEGNRSCFDCGAKGQICGRERKKRKRERERERGGGGKKKKKKKKKMERAREQGW